jgi:uncharacterized protein YciI
VSVSYFAVTRAAGPSWLDGRPAFEQPAVAEHTRFMTGLTDDGLVLFGGPLAGSEQGRIRVLLIVEAASEAEIRRRLADDPWALTDRLVISSIEPWVVLVGADRLAGPGVCV